MQAELQWKFVANMSAGKDKESADSSIKYKEQFTKKKLHGFLSDLLRVGSLKVRLFFLRLVHFSEVHFLHSIIIQTLLRKAAS